MNQKEFNQLIPTGYEVNWFDISWPNFAYDDSSPDELILDWLAEEIKQKPKLLIKKTRYERRPSTGISGK